MASTCKGVNEKLIEPSENQMDPYRADPNDFIVLKNGGEGTETLPFNGSCGDSLAEYRRLTKRDRDKGKSTKSTTRDSLGRQLA